MEIRQRQEDRNQRQQNNNNQNSVQQSNSGSQQSTNSAAQNSINNNNAAPQGSNGDSPQTSNSNSSNNNNNYNNAAQNPDGNASQNSNDSQQGQQQNSQDRNQYDNNSGGIGGGGRIGIIAGSAAGAILTLALLAFIWWRRRRGATYADIVRFRKHTSSVVFEQDDEGKVAATPIYRHDRYSVHISQPEALKNVSPPPLLAETSQHRDSVVENNVWKSATPPLPSPEEKAWPLTDKPPALAVNKSSPRLHGAPRYQPSRSKNSSGFVRQNTNGTTTRDDDEQLKGPDSPEDPQGGGRWSWTKSQAPSTPRAEAPNARASLTSLTSLRFSKLMRNHSRGRAEKLKGAGVTKPRLKNHATTPVLAPPNVGRKASKKNRRPGHGRVGSLSMIFKPGGSGNNSPQALSPVSPEAKFEDSRMSNSTAATISPDFEMATHHRLR